MVLMDGSRQGFKIHYGCNLKKAKFNKEPLLAKFRLLKPFLKPFLGLEHHKGSISSVSI
ncbi:hypothetical protein HanIR_Chr17g0874611 [Helianthus annuus]|nr:hypothetical protein HanIR_Chr17g0874611 [Helianthus annuus]